MNPSSRKTPLTQIGHYRILEVLGAGGVATVYKAIGPDGGLVAIKVLHSGGASDEDRQRLRREYKVLRSLDHPNIVGAVDRGDDDGLRWIALEYVDGPSLDRLLELWRENPPADRVAASMRIVRPLISALAYIHERKLFHRDIKPSNVLLTSRGEPRLTDFGAVKTSENVSTHLTTSGKLIGTVAFMAPEQITSDTIDARTDLYALGALLYNLLTGHRPVEADSIAGYLTRHLMEQPTPPIELNPNIPVHLSRVTMRLLRKDPDQRYASANDLQRALDGGVTPRRPPIVGQRNVLSAFDDALVALEKGNGTVFLVLGPPRSGRTAALQELVERAREDRIAAQLVPANAVDAPDRVDQALASGGPTVVALDDLDRSTPARVAEIVRRVRNHGAPVLIAAALTGEQELPPIAVRLILPLTALIPGNTTPVVYPLAPLDDEGTIAMMRALGFTGGVAMGLGRRLFALTGGRPGALREQLDALHEAGWLAIDASGLPRLQVPLEQIRHQPLPIPARRRREVQAAFERLNPPQKALLQALAVLGDEAEASLADAVTPGCARALEAGGLDEWLELRSEGIVDVARFRQPEAARVLLDNIDPRLRRKMHHLAAEALLSRHKRRQAAVGATIARHFVQAGEPDRAYPLLVQAAQRAVRRHEIAEALRCADQALRLHDEAAPALGAAAASLRLQALAARGEALLATRHPEEAREVLELSLQIAGTAPANDPAVVRTELDVRALLGMALGDLGEAKAALEHLDAALARMEQGAALRFAALRAKADALVMLDSVDNARAIWERSLEAARRIGSPGHQGAAMLGLGELELRLDRPDEALRVLREAEPLLRSARSQRALAITLCDIAYLNAMQGRYSAASTRAADAVQVAREAELPDLYCRALVHHAEAILNVGDPERARELISHALAMELAQEELEPETLTLLHQLVYELLGPDAVAGLTPLPNRPQLPSYAAARHDLTRARVLARDPAQREVARELAKRASALTESTSLTALHDAATALLTQLG